MSGQVTTPLGALALVGFGALEGYAFFKSGLYDPEAVHSQFQFRTFAMLKLFIAGVGASMIGNAITDVWHHEKFEESRRPKNPGMLRAVTGCAILGSGMALAGVGPSLIPGSMLFVKNAIYAVAGAVAAGVVYSIIEAKFPSLNGPQLTYPAANELQLDKKLGVSYSKIGFLGGAALLAAAFGMEAVFDHKKDMQYLGATFNSPLLPAIAGTIIGLNQFPQRIFAGHGAGASSSVMTIVSGATGGLLSPRYFPKSLASIGQFLYVYIGTTVGVYYCMQTTPEAVAPHAFPPVRSFLGGFLLLLGSRYAQGCTCGTGLTGTSALEVHAFPAAAAIFGGGILTALFI